MHAHEPGRVATGILVNLCRSGALLALASDDSLPVGAGVSIVLAASRVPASARGRVTAALGEELVVTFTASPRELLRAVLGREPARSTVRGLRRPPARPRSPFTRDR